MATRQTASKSAKRGTSSAAKKPATGAKTTTASRAAKATPATAASRTARGATSIAPDKATSSLAGRAARSWRATLTWAGGGGPFATLIVSILGLGDAAYLTYQHFTQATSFAGCSDKGTVNCEAVTTSAWSHLWIFPVSVLGLAFFAFMVAINSPWGWRARWQAVHWARLGSVIVGIVFVLYLIWAELFRINAICLYCTGVHVLTFILFALIVGQVTFSGVRPIPDNR